MCRVQTSVLLVALIVGLAQSWDIAVSAGDRLEFYTEDGIKTDTVRFNNQNLYALAYNEVNNMLLYIDKQSDNDTICGYDISFGEYKCYLERNGRNIQDLAFDPVTELMFFTDTKERSINWFSFESGSKNNVHGNLLIKLDDGIPTDIALDSCRGFIYWIRNTNLTTSTIERARFNGSEREVVINAAYEYDLHGLAIDQQTQKIYWDAPESYHKRHTFSADLNGKNSQSLITWTTESDDIMTFIHPNTFTVSKKYIYTVDWCTSCGPKSVRYLLKPKIEDDFKKRMRVHTDSLVDIAANYKMKDQFQGILACSHVSNNDKTKDSIRIAREYEGLFCVHGIKVIEQSLCKCTPGYIGVRCEVSVCENFCLEGNCSVTEEGLPKCRCVAGYSGQRCEVNVCNDYCLNNGTCSLNEEDEPVCECVGKYEGERCGIPTGLSNGDSSINEGDEPACQCNASRDDSIRKTIENKPMSINRYSAEGNLTLADLFANWRKPVSKITVVVEA